ncbi:hypothetical protein EO92_18565 [Methanosarcina sp. 2.H.A.1B.4]|nr:hypothetical protein EO92_18565 [Methanosarcina sp. 2.H.A.1B.4]
MFIRTEKPDWTRKRDWRRRKKEGPPVISKKGEGNKKNIMRTEVLFGSLLQPPNEISSLIGK